MRLCRFRADNSEIHVGLITEDGTVLDLSEAGVNRMKPLLELDHTADKLSRLMQQCVARHSLDAVHLVTPVESQEVWAAGVTYVRSKQARMTESEFSATAYDRVYDAERPEIFFKSLPEKVVSPGAAVGIRRDSAWNVPEPELALVVNSSGKIVGFTIGNDMSSRDIEGENLLYLPQAKIYTGSCALGPWIVVGASEDEARSWTIVLEIRRAGQSVFTGETPVSRIKRSFTDLVRYLFRSQAFPSGVVLLTGTGIVPPDTFTLQAGDSIRISITGIGELENPVEVV